MLPPWWYINIFVARCFPGKCFHTEEGREPAYENIGNRWTAYKNIVIHGFRGILLDEDNDEDEIAFDETSDEDEIEFDETSLDREKADAEELSGSRRVSDTFLRFASKSHQQDRLVKTKKWLSKRVSDTFLRFSPNSGRLCTSCINIILLMGHLVVESFSISRNRAPPIQFNSTPPPHTTHGSLLGESNQLVPELDHFPHCSSAANIPPLLQFFQNTMHHA